VFLSNSISVAGISIPLIDLLAFGWFLLAFGGYQSMSRMTMFEQAGIAGAVQRHRITWMRNMARRENRMMDSMLMQQLGQGNAFFASTSAIGIGGLAALIGSGEKLKEMLERFPLVGRVDPAILELKMLLLIAIFVYAFFKFAWAFRLSHYTGIMIGATPMPDGTNAEDCERHARAAADLIGIAADHANRGLRSFYYAFAAMSWFFHPVLFFIATTWVLAILVRRDFFSRSYRTVAATTPV
jgi:uncharacterized membrane protein